MKRALTILLLLVSTVTVGQVVTIRVPDSVTAFGMNLPVGTEVYDLLNKMAWQLDSATASTTTLQTAKKTRINNEGILRIFADAPYSAYITTNSDRAKDVILTADSGLMGTLFGNEFKLKNIKRTLSSLDERSYNSLTDIPSTFAPSSHTHDQYRELLNHDSLSTLDEKSYNSLTDIPSTFAPSSHTHTQSDITALVDTINDRYRRKDTTDVLLSILRAGHDYSPLTHYHNYVSGKGSGETNYMTKWNNDSTLTKGRIYDDGTGNVRIDTGLTILGGVNFNSNFKITATLTGSANQVLSMPPTLMGAAPYGLIFRTITHDGLSDYNAAKHFYQKDIDTVNTDLTGILTVRNGLLSAITDNSSNWDDAYGWGDHAGLYPLLADSNKTSTGNYITRKFVTDNFSPIGHNHDGTYLKTETDPVFASSAAGGISSGNISAWNGKMEYFDLYVNSTSYTRNYNTSQLNFKSGTGVIVSHVDGYMSVQFTADTSKLATRYWANQTFSAIGHTHNYVSIADSNKTSAGNYITRKFVTDNFSAIGHSHNYVSSVSASSPLQSSGGYTPTISIIPDSLSVWYTKMNKGATAFSWGDHSGLYSAIGHNHSGTYDNYQYWTLYLAGLTTIQLTSLNNLVFSPGTGITLGYEYSGGLNYVTFNNSAPFPGFGTSHSTSAYGDHNHSGTYLESEVDGSVTNEGVLSFADSSGMILLKSNTSVDRIRMYGSGGVSLNVMGSTGTDRYIDVSGSSLVPYTGATADVNLGNYAIIAKKARVSDSITGPNYMVTKEGGYAVKMIAGCSLEQGDVVCVTSAGTVTKTSSATFYNSTIGVAYNTASASGSVYVVVNGRALVKFTSQECNGDDIVLDEPNAGNYAAVGQVFCDNTPYPNMGEDGKAVNVTGQTGFQIIGVILETKSAGQSAYVMLTGVTIPPL